MKKIYIFFIAFLLVTFVANAQITITQSDMPTVNMTFTEVTDTICSAVSIGNAGTYQTWNLANIGNSYQFISSCVNPTTLPAASSFPTANAAFLKQGGQDSYIKISSTSIEVLGIYGNFGSPIGVQSAVFSPSMKYIQLPSTYQTSFNGTYTFEIKVPVTYTGIDSLRMSFVSNYSSIVDGWGNVTTPVFSNVPSLRQKNVSYTTIKSFVHNSLTGWISYGTPQYDTTISYQWYSNQQKSTLAEIETDVSGTVVQATYLLSTGIVGINENTIKESKVKVFPNPALDVINFSGVQQNKVLVIFDSNGKLMSNKLLNTRKNTINISDYSNGMYFYQILDMKGQSIDKGKFTVLK